MTAKELNLVLIEKFPHLEAMYLEEIEWQDGHETGSHIVYGDIFTPYLLTCVLSNALTDFTAAFRFLEELLELDIPYVTDVIYYSVVEGIAHTITTKHPELIPTLGTRVTKALFTFS